MLRRLQALVVLGVCVVSIPVAAVEPEDVDLSTPGEAPAANKDAPAAATADGTPAAKEAPAAAKEAPAAKAPVATEAPAAAPPPTTEVKPDEQAGGWHTEVHGYFRAPLTLGLSHRPDPDNMNGPPSTQISYGPNRTVNSSYYSFAYTRIQEQDWAELFFHMKKKHVDAAVGWMGYWFQGVGFRNPDAAWLPGLAYLTLDTDLDAGSIKPNLAATMGAFWPKYGYFEKYDTYTLGRFRQIGEELNFTVPFNSDISAVFTEGFGAGRDGSFNNTVQPPIYGAITALDLVTWANVKLMYKKLFDVGLHYNTEWTADPNLAQQGTPGDKSYGAVKQAHLTVIGGEANLRAPYFGHLWLSPSYIHVRNGWALNQAGTEVLHSLGGMGVATNYLFWGNTPAVSTGTGSVTDVGFLYENSLSSIQGKQFGTVLPDVSFSLFGLLTKAKADLPAPTPGITPLTQSTLNEFKYGADATLQATNWFGFMLRYDFVNMDMDHPGYVFYSITPRMIFSSHFLSSERMYIQYSRYKYGDNMKLAGTWPAPWGQPIVAGSTVLQEGPYGGMTPDRNVVKLQAEIAF